MVSVGVGDGYCDDFYNNIEYEYDGGDCITKNSDSNDSPVISKIHKLSWIFKHLENIIFKYFAFFGKN